MWDIINNILASTQPYMPHGNCYLWQTSLVSLHVASDSLIALAYFSIPAILLYFIFRRQDVPFRHTFVLFSTFIILCGIGHLFNVWTLWYPAYWISGIEQAVTALVSCYTAGSMVILIPRFLSLKTPEELEQINQQLQAEINRRQQTENALRFANSTLEKRVEQRTYELEAINEMLTAEIKARQQTKIEMGRQLAAVEAASDGIAILENNHYLYLNQAHVQLFGYEHSEDLLGQSWHCCYSLSEKERFEREVFPILERDRKWQGEAIATRQDGSTFTEGLSLTLTEDNLLICVCRDISDRKQAEENLQIANQKLEQLAQTDALTNLANRRHFDQRLQQEWQHLQREQNSLALILLDVDYFKRYNDFYGHPRGDKCLFQLAQAIERALHRSTDLAARYGGEEFVVLLPYTDQEGATIVAKQIQCEIVALHIPHEHSEVSDWVTVSMGLAIAIPSQEQSPQQLISQADRALYGAKEQGRNGYLVSV